MRKSFPARFTSMCPECGDEIVGDLDLIVMLDGAAVHEDCAPEGPRLTMLPA